MKYFPEFEVEKGKDFIHFTALHRYEIGGVWYVYMNSERIYTTPVSLSSMELLNIFLSKSYAHFLLSDFSKIENKDRDDFQGDEKSRAKQILNKQR